MLKNLRKKKKGFTLIELIIVIAIIAILSALALPKFGEVRKDASQKADIANAKTIANAATALIAEGDLSSNNNVYEVNKDQKDAQGNKATNNGTMVANYLQNVPKTSGKGSFYLKVDTEGNVLVSTDSEGKKIVFPSDN